MRVAMLGAIGILLYKGASVLFYLSRHLTRRATWLCVFSFCLVFWLVVFSVVGYILSID